MKSVFYRLLRVGNFTFYALVISYLTFTTNCFSYWLGKEKCEHIFEWLLHNAVKYDLQIPAVRIHPSEEPLHHMKNTHHQEMSEKCGDRQEILSIGKTAGMALQGGQVPTHWFSAVLQPKPLVLSKWVLRYLGTPVSTECTGYSCSIK